MVSHWDPVVTYIIISTVDYIEIKISPEVVALQ